MELVFENKDTTLYYGDAFDVIDEIPEDTIQSVITSPTYWGKRSFTKDSREFGSESLESYVKKNVILYSKILEKIKDGGSLFFIMQDSYMGSGVSRSHHINWEKNKHSDFRRDGLDSLKQGNTSSVTAHHDIIENKSLCGIPFRIAIKLVDFGYIWRQTIIWEKPNPMPTNVKDRARQSSEYIFHFVKNRIYKFNQEPFQTFGKNGELRMPNQVWTSPPEPKRDHSATFPRSIVTPLLLATTDRDDTVFDPFLGSGTMYYICKKYGRNFIGCDINKDFVTNLRNRINTSLDAFLE